jgi:hypothetical protein
MFDSATTVLMLAPFFLCSTIIIVHLLPSMYVMPNLNTMVIDLATRAGMHHCLVSFWGEELKSLHDGDGEPRKRKVT